MILVPSSHGACIGDNATTLLKVSTFRSVFSGSSPEAHQTVIDQVSLSLGIVMIVTVPTSVTTKPKSGGGDPEK